MTFDGIFQHLGLGFSIDQQCNIQLLLADINTYRCVYRIHFLTFLVCGLTHGAMAQDTVRTLSNETGRGTYLTHVLQGTKSDQRHSAWPHLPPYYPMEMRYAQYTKSDIRTRARPYRPLR